MEDFYDLFLDTNNEYSDFDMLEEEEWGTGNANGNRVDGARLNDEDMDLFAWWDDHESGGIGSQNSSQTMSMMSSSSSRVMSQDNTRSSETLSQQDTHVSDFEDISFSQLEGVEGGIAVCGVADALFESGLRPRCAASEAPQMQHKQNHGAMETQHNIPLLTAPTRPKRLDAVLPIASTNLGLGIEGALVTSVGPSSRDIIPFEKDNAVEKDREWVIRKIEKIFASLQVTLKDAARGIFTDLVLALKVRGARGSQRFNPLMKSIHTTDKYTIRLLRFPGNSETEAWRFGIISPLPRCVRLEVTDIITDIAVLLKVLGLILEALHDGKITTKRDIYYKEVSLFRKQSVVDSIVDDIAYTFGVPRSGLNVVAAAKGLVCGHMKIYYRNGETVDCHADREGMLIPSVREIERLDVCGAEWVMIIEKEATFRALASNRFWNSSTAGKGILITGKGYPDIATREFLRLVSDTIRNGTRKIQIQALVDYDPHGIDILSCYKYGSAALAHENHRLVVGEVQWLGVKSEDLGVFGKSREATGANCAYTESQLLRLTARDRRKAVKMLEREYITCENGWRAELQRMLFMNVKAEMQLLDDRGKLEDYLTRKLSQPAENLWLP